VELRLLHGKGTEQGRIEVKDRTKKHKKTGSRDCSSGQDEKKIWEVLGE
jgi:hypothetical protein